MTHKAFLLAGFIFLSTGIIYAQVNYKPGYIIQANRDTIWGEIAYRGDVMMSQECRFREKSGAEARYSPSEIAGYRFDDGKYFVSRRFNGEDIFLEFLIKGKVSIFYFRDNYTDRYLIEKEGDSLVELPYEETLKYDRDKQYLQKSTKHIRLLQFYMSDAPGLQSRIDDIEKPGHGNLIKLATDYHYAVCDDEECLIYAKKTSSFKCNIEISAGYRKFRDTGESFFPMGVLAHIWLPRSNEKLYVKTGSVYSKFRTLKKFEYKYYDYNGDPQTK